MEYKSFFLSEKYKHPHKRHDPVGSEDQDVNNDGKVDINDKYQMAKRRLYQQYKQMKQSKKTSDFSIPQLENNMIRLMGLVNLNAVKEVKMDEPTTSPTVAHDEKEGDKQARLEMMLKKLKEMQMSPEQEKKVDEMMAKMEALVGGQKKLDMDGDGKLTAKDFEMLRNKKDEVIAEEETEEKEDTMVGEDHEVSMAQNLINDIIKNNEEDAMNSVRQQTTNRMESGE